MGRLVVRGGEEGGGADGGGGGNGNGDQLITYELSPQQVSYENI